ncbi:MAG: PKD domain-containing protein [Caldilineaceae bacterium]
MNGAIAPCFIVRAVDEAGNVSQIEVTVNISNLPPIIEGWVVPSTVHFGGAVQLAATATDPGGDPLNASVNWGDGQLEAVVVKPDGSIQAAHTYAGAGAFPVTLIVSDDEGLTVSDTRNIGVYSPVETINLDLIPDTLNMVNQGVLNQGQADSLVVKLQGAVIALQNDRPSAPQKLGAYLNEYVAVVPNGALTPCFLMATDIRNNLILHGWVPEPT